jgi:cytochrome c oxidase cbb3-type subunit 3
MRGPWIRCVIAILLACVVAACADSDAASLPDGESTQAARQATSMDTTARFVQHPEHITPGLAGTGRWASLRNPYEGNAARIGEGAKLFVAYNCIDCHGADGSGAMGPSLADGRWHFGGSAGEVFQSIYEGRPDGMPAWGGRIGDDQIWRLVAYVRSLEPTTGLATENFTGATIERTGH